MHPSALPGARAVPSSVPSANASCLRLLLPRSAPGSCWLRQPSSKTGFRYRRRCRCRTALCFKLDVRLSSRFFSSPFYRLWIEGTVPAPSAPSLRRAWRPRAVCRVLPVLWVACSGYRVRVGPAIRVLCIRLILLDICHVCFLSLLSRFRCTQSSLSFLLLVNASCFPSFHFCWIRDSFFSPIFHFTGSFFNYT